MQVLCSGKRHCMCLFCVVTAPCSPTSSSKLKPRQLLHTVLAWLGIVTPRFYCILFYRDCIFLHFKEMKCGMVFILYGSDMGSDSPCCHWLSLGVLLLLQLGTWESMGIDIVAGRQSVINLASSAKESQTLSYSLTWLSFSYSCLPSSLQASLDKSWFRINLRYFHVQ